MEIDWSFAKETFFQVGNFWGQSIVYLIMALFAMGTLMILVHFARISLEKFWLARVRRKFDPFLARVRLGKTAEDDPQAPKNSQELEQELLQAKNELQAGIPRRSIISRRIEDLFQVRYVGHLTCQTFKDILYTKELEKTGLPRYLMGSFILLGLIGTVLGLSHSVVQMQPMLGKLNVTSDLSALANTLTETLKGMRTAFSATIAGILATVLMAFFSFLYGKYATGFLVALENFTTVRLIPFFLVPTTEEAAIRFAESLSKSAEALDRTTYPLEKISGRFEVSVQQIEIFSANLKTLGERYVDALTNLTQAQAALTEQQSQARKESRELLARFEQTAAQFQESVVAMKGNQQSLFQGVAASAIADIQEANRQVVAETRKIVQEFTTALGSLSQESRAGFDRIENEVLQHVQSISQKMQDSVRQTMDELLKGQLADQERLIAKHDEVSQKYAALITAERENMQNVMKLIDLSTIMLDKNHYEEMRQREQRVLAAVETLGKRLGELAAEIAGHWEARKSLDPDYREKAEGINLTQ